jgi:hypothetical protein
VPVPCFCCFCVSEKLHRKYSRNWPKQKPKFLFFPKHHGVQSWDGGVPGARRTIGWRGPAPGRATRWCGRLAHLLTPPSSTGKPKGPNQFTKTYCKPPPSSTQDREGLEALPDTLPERGITAGGLLYHHACLWSDMWVVYLGLRVHSSS